MPSARESVLFTPARLIPLLLLSLLPLPAIASPVIDMELKAGLGGLAVSGRATEMMLRLFSTSPIDGHVEITDSNGVATLPVRLDEQREKIWWLPVNPGAPGSVRVRLITNQGRVIEKQQAFEHSRRPVTIISSTIPAGFGFSGHQQSGRIRPVILSTAGLPHVAQAYAGVGAIVSDAQFLSKLTRDQYHALGQYLGGCGIMLVSDADPAVLERLRDISGCNGHSIDTYADLSAVTALLLRLDAERPPGPPAPAELMPLQRKVFQQRMVSSLSFYLCGYVIFIALVAWRIKTTRYLLLLPVLVAGAGALAWSGTGGHQLISWAETQSGDQYSRVSSLLLLGGDRMGHSSVLLGPDSRLAAIGGDLQLPGIHYQDDGRHRELSGDTRLLVPRACELTSVSRYSPPFSLTLRDGQPQVILQAQAFPHDTRLLWRGHAFTVPVLTKGESWQPLESPGHEPGSPAERLLNRRLAFGDPALLLPFGPGMVDAGGADTQATGWLAIRHEAGRQ